MSAARFRKNWLRVAGGRSSASGCSRTEPENLNWNRLKKGPRASKWQRRLPEFRLPQSVVGEGRVRVPDTLQALVHALIFVSILFRSGSYEHTRFSTRRRADCSKCTGHPVPRRNVGEGTETAAAVHSGSIGVFGMSCRREEKEPARRPAPRTEAGATTPASTAQ